MSYPSGYPYPGVPPGNNPPQPAGYPNYGLNVGIAPPHSGGYPSMPGTGYPSSGYPPGQNTGYPASGYPSGVPATYPSSGYPPGSGYPGGGYPAQPHSGYPGGGYPQPSATYPGGNFPSAPPSTYPGSGFPAYPPTNFPPGCYSTVPPTNQSSPAYPPTGPSRSQVPTSTFLPSPNSAFSGGQSFRSSSPVPNTAPAGTMSGRGTVVEHQPFDAQSDAQVLRKAMKGFGTDEKAIINVLAHRTNNQRQQISMAFKQMFGKDLIDDLKSELSGRFEDMILALMTPYFIFLAREVHRAISGVGTDEDALVEILCTRNNWELREINSAYHSLYGKPLERDIRSDTSGHFERLLVSMCAGSRREDPADPAKAKADAQALHQAGVAHWGTDESTFNAILAASSFQHLSAVLYEYYQLAGHSVAQAIDREMSGDVKRGLLAIVRSVENRPAYFAEKLHKAMKGMGTEDRTLIRIIATRSEIDLATIKEEYHKTYGKTLEKAIADDTSGDYKRALVELVSG